jgi:hypothetical protein
MKVSSNSQWDKLPKHIVINLANYSPLLFQMELRLINKHWRSSLNTLVFNSLKNFKIEDYYEILESYGYYVKFVSNSILEFTTIEQLKLLCPNIEGFTLVLTTQTLDKSLQLIKIYENNLNSLELTNYVELKESTKLSLDNFFNTAYNLKYLTNVKFSSIGKYKHPVLKFSNLHKLRSIGIRSGSLNCSDILKELEKLEEIREINWEINYYGSAINNFGSVDYLVTPNTLLINNKMSSIVLSNLHYNDVSLSILSYLCQALINLFSNPKFNNLTSLNWTFLLSNYNLNNLFSNQLPKTSKWPNLTKLSLFNIDGYLLAYIIEHFPNLKELVMLSKLILPFGDDPLTLQPLLKLKKLLAGGFSKNLVGKEFLIRYLFPNIETLNASYLLSGGLNTSADDNEAIIDAYYIPLLFPKLKSCILSSPDYELDDLIYKFEGEIMWEELYICLSHSNFDLIGLLLDKLPFIKAIYFYSRGYRINMITKKAGLRCFIADIDDDNGNDFGFCKLKEI